MWAFHFKKEKVWIACFCFFFPFEPVSCFFSSLAGRRNNSGWLARNSLGPQWKWMSHIAQAGTYFCVVDIFFFFFPLPCARISSMAWSTVTDSGILGLTCCSGAMTGYMGFSISAGDGCKCSSPGWKVGRKVQTTEKTGVFRRSSSHQKFPRYTSFT